MLLLGLLPGTMLDLRGLLIRGKTSRRDAGECQLRDRERQRETETEREREKGRGCGWVRVDSLFRFLLSGADD